MKVLEPKELTKEEELIVISRMKKMAKDPKYKFANALELVHQSYLRQPFERQTVVGDLVRPTPTDRAAWKQYESFIELAVKLLAKYRGIDGDWRTDKFASLPVNYRSSIASTAAAKVKEGYIVKKSALYEGLIVKNPEKFIEKLSRKFTLFKEETLNNYIILIKSKDGKISDKIVLEKIREESK
jgi:hypothetical protein